MLDDTAFQLYVRRLRLPRQTVALLSIEPAAAGRTRWSCPDTDGGDGPACFDRNGG